MTTYPTPSIWEALGLLPPRKRFQQALIALRGAEDVPPSRFDVSSLALLRPRLALPLWRGRCPIRRKVLITNLFNHCQTPVEDGWSVRRTQVEDFRGRGLTYDSHNGTDLCVPRGTVARAPAAGRVARIYSEFNRGGLKVIIDHGQGLMTCSAHLARALVGQGEELEAGQPYALTGYSGLDGFSTFPWGVPHIHFNVWLDSQPVDPFGDQSLWQSGWPMPIPDPIPGDAAGQPKSSRDASFDERRVDQAIARCKTKAVREWLSPLSPLRCRALILISEMCYYPTRFPQRGSVYARTHPRQERLWLPFSREDFDGAVLVDEL